MSRGIPSALYSRLRTTLAECAALQDDDKLRQVFLQDPLYPWRGGVPQRNTVMDRVDAVMHYLHSKFRGDSGHNALVLLLLALHQQTDPGDALRGKLLGLARELAEVVGGGLPVEATGADGNTATTVDAHRLLGQLRTLYHQSLQRQLHLETRAANYGPNEVPYSLHTDVEQARATTAQALAQLQAMESSLKNQDTGHRAPATNPNQGAGASGFDQRDQTTSGAQTNIGQSSGPVFSGTFHGPVTVGGGNSSTSEGTPNTSQQPAGVVDTATLRQALQRYDDVDLDALCMDHFPDVYDKFGRGMGRVEKINLLLGHCRRVPGSAEKLQRLVGGA